MVTMPVCKCKCIDCDVVFYIEDNERDIKHFDINCPICGSDEYVEKCKSEYTISETD
jgi:hypothetical protein